MVVFVDDTAIEPLDRAVGPPGGCAISVTRELRIGVIGYGYWGPKLVRNLSQLPGARLAAIAEMRADRLAEAVAAYPVAYATQDHRDLLGDDLDALVIATPVKYHYPLARAALLAGKHVLVEKPITSKSDEARELIAVAEEIGLTLMVGHTFVYNPAVEAVRRIVQSGELGQIYYLDSARVNLGLLQPDINVMWDLGPHDISLIRYILASDPLTVSARGTVYINKPNNLHEVVYATLTFEGGIIANLRLSWLDPVKQRRLTVVGSKKMLVYDDIADNKVVIYDQGVEVPPYSVTEEEFHASYRHGEETTYPLEWVEPLRVECQHFLDCIRTGARPRSSGEDGLRVVKVLESAQRSLRNGGVQLEIEYA